VAGLSVDLTILKHLYLVELAIGLILIASLGKLVGCYIGGRLGQLSSREATALAIGMNARGTTEIIVASIGLSIGVVSQDIYTLIVVMAVTTTMVMPPMLRWALARIPPTGEEKQRLEREQAEKKDFIPKVERLLITADQSEDGKLASILGGLFAGSRKIMATVLDLGLKEYATHSVVKERIEDWVKLSIEFATRKEEQQNGGDAKAPAPLAQLNTQSSTEEPSAAVLKEVKKGYDMLFIGLEQALPSNADALNTSIEKIVSNFKGALAIVVAKDKMAPKLRMRSMNILVPTSGAEYSRRAGEVAIAIAKACRCGVTALHVYPPQDEGLFMLRIREHLKPARALVRALQELGEREGVPVKTVVRVRRAPESVILRQIKKGQHNLVVLGVNVRPGEGVFFGHKVKVLLERVPCSLLLVVSS
jgi:nucleotide-binding universal stress UspA family protein